MKTSVIASMLLASMALAAPLDRRARLTKTEIITTTVYSTTTIYDDEPAPAPTSSQGLFYEQPPSSAPVAPTSAPAVQAPAPSSKAAPAPAPSVQAQPQPQASQAPASSAPAPAPVVTSAAPVAPAQPSTPAAAPTSAAAPAPAQPSSQPSSSTPSTGGYQYTDVDLTVYNGYGGKGACETTLNDSDMFVALSQGIFGPATYNVQTGAPTNKWCGVSITIEYNGKTVTAPVQDRCAGCAGENDVDVSPAVWQAFGLDPAAGGRYKANWSKAS